MQTNYRDGHREFLQGLSEQEVRDLTERNLNDPEVESWTVTPNRRERRRQAALERKQERRKARRAAR